MEDPVVMQFRYAIKDHKYSEKWNPVASFRAKWDRCKMLALSQMPSCTPYRVSNILYCCSKGIYFDELLLDTVLTRAANDEGFLLEFGPIGMSMCIQSLGVISRFARLERRWEGKPIEQTAKGFALNMMNTFHARGVLDQDSITARNVSTTLHGLGLLFHKEDDSPISLEISRIVEALLKILILRGQNGKVMDMDMSNAVLGCAHMGFKNPAYIKDVCLLVTWRLAHEEPVGLQTLSNMIWALGKIEFKDRDIVTKLAKAVIEPYRLPEFSNCALCGIPYSLANMGYANPVVLEPLANEIGKPHRMKEFTTQELGSIVYGFGKVGCSTYFFEIFGQELIKDHRLAAMDTQTISNAFYGFGRANYFNATTMKALLNEAQGRLSRFSSLDLTCITHGLALLEKKIFGSSPKFECAPFLEALSTECQRRLSILSTRAICNICRCFSQLRFTDKPFMDLLLERYSEILIGDEEQFVAEEFGMIVHACARLNFHNPLFLKFATSFFRSNIKSIDSIQVLCNVLWGCAVLGILEIDLFLAVCKQIEALNSSGTNIAQEEWLQLAHVWMYLTMIRKHEAQLPDYARLIIMQAIAKWRKGNKPLLSSVWEAKVAKLLTDTGIPYTAQAAVADGLFQVDFHIPDCKPPIVIECDGPWHFSHNKLDGSYVDSGETLLRNMLLESHGFKVSSPKIMIDAALSCICSFAKHNRCNFVSGWIVYCFAHPVTRKQQT